MEFVNNQKSPAGFDIVLANPPYVRADAKFEHIQDEIDRQKAIEEWKKYRENLKKSKIGMVHLSVRDDRDIYGFSRLTVEKKSVAPKS
ncbi:MAG: hypothetical protein MAG431_00775 [Chloroflexi bacterium]|nr:hypothetical protein [Chloroflexota bacterium]